MKQKGYTQFIAERVSDYGHETPIYNDDVALGLAEHFNLDADQARAVVNVTMARQVEKNNLIRYGKGIYYRARSSAFGYTHLNPDLVSRDRYIVNNGEIIGYITGASAMNKLGLSTQIPRYLTIASNRYMLRGSRIDKKLQICLRRPKTVVTGENHLFLQLLDVIENKDKIEFDHLNPDGCIRSYISRQGMDVEKLVIYAGKFYSKNTQLNLVKIIAGAMHETTPGSNFVSNHSINSI